LGNGYWLLGVIHFARWMGLFVKINSVEKLPATNFGFDHQGINTSEIKT